MKDKLHKTNIVCRRLNRSHHGLCMSVFLFVRPFTNNVMYFTAVSQVTFSITDGMNMSYCC